MSEGQKIRTCLWFEREAEEAMGLYLSLFEGARVVDEMRTDDGLVTATFELAGQELMVLNGRPQGAFTEAASLYVQCDSQEEVDRLWAALTADGGEEQPCGWLKDRYGVSWQIIPRKLMECLGHPDPAKAQRAMEAMLSMKKIDIAKVEASMG